jgi:hypothetical protein
MPQMRKILVDGATFKQLVNDISGRQDLKDGGLNFFEYMFIRRCGIAWGISNNQQISITKTELFDIALIIMLPYKN